MAELTTQLLNEPLVDRSGRMNQRWYIFFRDQQAQVASTPQSVIPPVEVTAQEASISTTPLPTEALAPGLYRVSYYARVTRAATSSSSLTVTITWTDGSVACSFSGAALTGNTTGTLQTETLLIEIDQASPVSYATTYATSGATTMQYKLAIVLEAVSV